MKFNLISVHLDKNNVVLFVSTALLLGFSYPPFPLGILAFIGLVPFLLLIDRINSFWRFFRYSYATFFVFCIITLYWVGGFTHRRDPYLMLAGGALLLFQPLFFTLIGSVYYAIRKIVHSEYAVFTLPFIWVMFEWLYALGEFSFPWLTLGNTQTYQLLKLQITEITGVYGLSFWILLINAVIYFIIRRNIVFQFGINLKRTVWVSLLLVLLYILPDIYGVFAIKREYGGNQKLNIGIVQPNVDPWEKWEGANSLSGRWDQVKGYLSLIDSHRNDSIDMAVLPESAILMNLPNFQSEYRTYKKFVDSTKIGIVSGYAKVTYYEHGPIPVSASKIHGTNIYYDSYNSILYTQPGIFGSQSYSKMRLVPFAERIPYAESVPFLIEPLRWGVGISNWGKGKDSTIFYDIDQHTKFLAMVCYESIFPEFVGSFVKKGAEFLIFITNDSWWGNTSGARQHKQYAVLRAVENRRWVIQCQVCSVVGQFG